MFTLDASASVRSNGSVLAGGSDFTLIGLDRLQRRSLTALCNGDDRSDLDDRDFVRFLADRNLLQPVPSDIAPADRTVSLVIPCRDHRDPLIRVLGRIDHDRFEHIIVVDDGSADPLHDLPGAVTILRHDRSQGAAAARNSGWRSTSSDVVLFLDADIDEPGSVLALMAVFDDPDIGAVAPRIVGSQNASTTGGPQRWIESLDMGTLASSVAPRTRVPYVPTAAMLVRRRALLSIDGFDPTMPLGEDVDLVWRLREAGWIVRYEPSVVSSHTPRRSERDWRRQRFVYGRSNAALAARHPEKVVAFEGTVGNVVPWLCAFTLTPLGSAVGLAAATIGVFPLWRRFRRLGADETGARAVRDAVDFQLLGLRYAGGALATGVRRSWLPGAAIVCVLRRRSMIGLAAAMIVPHVRSWRTQPESVTVHRWVGAHLADDVSYCAGQWAESLRRRSFRSLRPSISPLRRFFVHAPAVTLREPQT